MIFILLLLASVYLQVEPVIACPSHNNSLNEGYRNCSNSGTLYAVEPVYSNSDAININDCSSIINLDLNQGYFKACTASSDIFILPSCNLRRPTVLQYRNCLSHKTIAFIGDSVTRFQYLSLISYLASGLYEELWLWHQKQHDWVSFFLCFPERINSSGGGGQFNMSCNGRHGEYESWELKDTVFNFKLIAQQILSNPMSPVTEASILQAAKDKLSWAVTSGADTIVFNIGIWWVYSIDALMKAPEGTRGAALVRAYETIFYEGYKYKLKSKSNLTLIFKTTTPHNGPHPGFDLYYKLSPMLNTLAESYGWVVLDVGAVANRAKADGEAIFHDHVHMKECMNEHFNDLLYNLVC